MHIPDLKALYIGLTKHLPYLYLLFAVPLVYFSVTEIPPFQNPDEPNHFARAEQISRLIVVPSFVYDKTPVKKTDTALLIPGMILPTKGGFNVDKGVYELSGIYAPMFFHYSAKTSRAKSDSAKNIMWRTGIAYKNFGNTAIYPPLVYLVPALAIVIGKTAHLTVIKTFYIARYINGTVAVAICFIALLLAKRSKILLFTILLFPMVIAMFSSVSQDGLLISCAFLLIGIIDNAESNYDKRYSKWQQWLLVILISIISIGKPPYILFSFILLYLNLNKKTKIIGIAVPFMLVAAWLFVSAPNFSIKINDAQADFNSKLQLAHAIQHPFKFVGLFFNFDIPGIENFFKMFVGVLGWLDFQLPIDYYHTAYIIVFLAFISTVKLNLHDSLKLRIALFCIGVATLLAVLTAQYITWTPLDATYLGGMQGRYVIPFFPFFALAACLSVKEEKISKLRQYILVPVLLFPIITALVLADGIINRYYFK